MCAATVKTSSASLPHSASVWQPKPYMVDAVRFLVSRPAAGLFLPPGLGKTAIALHAHEVRRRAKVAKKMLVVAAVRICELTWPAEIEKWQLPFSVCFLHGPKKDRLLEQDFDVYLINYEGLGWLAKKPKSLLQKLDTLVLDESSKVKDTSTLRFKHVRKLLPCFKFRNILTGSPAPNALLDLFGQILVLDMGETFSPYITHFRNEYFFPSGFMGYEWTPKENAEELILEKLKPLVLCLPADLVDLPPISIIDRSIKLPPKAMAQYKQLENEFVLQWKSGTVTAANAAVAAGKLRQLAGGAVYDTDRNARMLHTEKIDALEELRDELAGEPIFVGYEYEHELVRLQKRFPQGETFAGLNKTAALDLCERFNKGKVPMLFGQPQSVAHGLNLQAHARVIVWLTLPWNLEYYEQFIQRIWRQGQKKKVLVYRIVATDTIDAAVMEALDTKDKRQQRLLTALEKRYGKHA